MTTIVCGLRPRAAIALAAVAVMLGGCAAERFSLGNLGAPAAPAQQPVAGVATANSAPITGAPITGAPMTSAPMSSSPMSRAQMTDAPVGAGIDVQPGGNEDFIVSVGRRVFFTEGSAQLTSIARATLDKQASWLGRHTQWNAKIQGFADDPGSDAANRTLALQRAEAVQAYLISKGVAPGRLRAKTYGREADRIVRACADASCKAQNRRVITNLEAARAR